MSRFPLADDSRERLEARLDVRVARVEATRVVRVVRVARAPSELDEVDVVELGADEDRLDVSGEGSRGVPRGVGRARRRARGSTAAARRRSSRRLCARRNQRPTRWSGERARRRRGGGRRGSPRRRWRPKLLERVALVVGRGPRGRGEERVGDEQVAPAEATILAGSAPRLRSPELEATATRPTRGPGSAHRRQRRNATTRRDGRHRREMTPRAAEDDARRHARPPSRETPRARRSASRQRAWRRRV